MMGIDSNAKRSFGTPISVNLSPVRESAAANPICDQNTNTPLELTSTLFPLQVNHKRQRIIVRKKLKTTLKE